MGQPFERLHSGNCNGWDTVDVLRVCVCVCLFWVTGAGRVDEQAVRRACTYAEPPLTPRLPHLLGITFYFESTLTQTFIMPANMAAIDLSSATSDMQSPTSMVLPMYSEGSVTAATVLQWVVF